MEGMEEKLGAILSNPEMMNTIMSMAKALGQSQPQPEQAPPCPPPPPPQQPSCNQQSAGSFLRQLLPRDFDTGDLMVIILLLLIAGDCEKERSNALLTLALYFIM